TKSTCSFIPSDSNISDPPVVYTDGACVGPSTLRQAGYGVYWGPADPRNVSERLSGEQTSNRAEIEHSKGSIEKSFRWLMLMALNGWMMSIRRDGMYCDPHTCKLVVEDWQRSVPTPFVDGGMLELMDCFVHVGGCMDAGRSAAITAARQAKEAGIPRIVIATDSKFTQQCATEWGPVWEKNGWKLCDGKPVKLRRPVERLLKAIRDSGVEVSWHYVPGHSGIEGNEEADRLANQGAKKPLPVHVSCVT
ncbi:hypothetical protein P879_11723, partial [Paragonimus westermani]